MDQETEENTEGEVSYFPQYYEANKQKISERRKKLYAEDPEYAEKARKAARKYRATLKKQKRLRGEKKLKRGPRIPETMMVNGVEVQVFTIKQMAKILRRSAVTLNYWERNGLLPETPVKLGVIRMYTFEMVGVVKEALKKRGRLDIGDESFCEEVKEGWRKLISSEANEEVSHGSTTND